MSAFENYFKAVEILMGHGLTVDEIGDVSFLIMTSFRQGTGLGGNDVHTVIDAVKFAIANKVQIAEVTKGRGFPSGSHWPKFVIVPLVCGNRVLLEFGTDGNFVAVATDGNRYEVALGGNTPYQAWGNYLIVNHLGE